MTKTNQVVRTPKLFLDAVVRRFGPIDVDLAANAENAVAPRWLGPGSPLAENSLVVPWAQFNRGGLGFCNPPFKVIAPWAAQHAKARLAGMRTALLVPASICTSWYRELVAPHSYVFELFPRVFPVEIRDCLLCLYEPAGYKGRETWEWR